VSSELVKKFRWQARMCRDMKESADLWMEAADALESNLSKLDAAVAELALANNYVRNTVELESRLGERDREIAANRRYIGEHIETIKSLETRLQSCELERDKYRAALMADRGEEAANRIRDEDRAFCLAHQTYFDSDIGCAKCNVVERREPVRPNSYLCEFHGLSVNSGGWCPKCNTEPVSPQSE
jgi:chromosome segregation ATPase